MSITLGLDIGTASIGWALIDENKKEIIRTGVRIFPEGVDKTKDKSGVSKNIKRRTARGLRRQIARRARRKALVKKILIESKLLPSDSKECLLVLQNDPYFLRKKALDEKLPPYELGRVLFNLGERRGFKSNRKTDRINEKENSEMLAEISQLENTIQESGSRTLGEYLFKIRSENQFERIRGKHTRRSMYENEFNLVWDTQLKHNKQLTEELKSRIYRAIFFQREIYWKKSTIGRCSLETNLPRASLKDRAAQLARLYQEVGNLQIIEADGEIRALKADESAKLHAYLASSKERTFENIRKEMGWINCEFNLSAGGREKLLGMPIDKEMESKPLFGKAWGKKSEEEKTKIVRTVILFAERGKEEEEEEFIKNAINDWSISKETAENLLKFNPGTGRSRFCFKALDKLIPFLQKGYPMMSEDGKESAFSLAGYQRPDQKVPNQRDNLPIPLAEITNPIVKQALYETRLLVNAIIREYGIPSEIHVELAREAKANKIQRENAIKTINKNKSEREEAVERIEESGLLPGRGSIEFYRLWKEQDGVCIYTGQAISLKQLLAGEVNVDHIWPFSRCLDDSFSNKVVCLRNENAKKANMTPREWLKKKEPHRWEEVLQRVRSLPYLSKVKKLERFIAKEVKLDDFINRQLTDTAYISKQVTSYLRCLGCKVVCGRGGVTAELRHQWGLNGILNPDKEGGKTREDHRHHAVDALVIAATNPSRLQALSKRKKDSIITPPWDTFRKQAEEKVLAILVSHKPNRKIRGQLHNETIYGPTQKIQSSSILRPWAKGTNWVEEPGVFTQRIELKDLKKVSDIEDIRDQRIKEIILEHIESKGVDLTNTKSPIDPSVWVTPIYVNKKTKISKNAAVINKVTILIKDKTIIPIGKDRRLIKTGSNHHFVLYQEIIDEKKIIGSEFVSLFEAHNRKKNKTRIFNTNWPLIPSRKFIMALCKRDMVLLLEDGKELLCVVEKFSSGNKQIFFRLHTDSNKSGKQISKYPSTFNGKKVTLDILGNLRDAGD